MDDKEAPIARHVMHLKELQFTVVATAYPLFVEYTIYDIGGYSQSTSGEFDVPEWPRIGSVSSVDTVSNMEEAEPYLSGSVKWDGCSNWHFDEQDRVMLHACDKEGLQRFGDVMALCWDWTAELCPEWLG